MGSRIFLFAMLSVAPFPTWGGQQMEVGVRVTCEKPTSLLLTARNGGTAPVQVPEAALPWNYSKVLDVEAFKVVDGKAERLVRVAPVADYLRTLQVAPRQALSGEINLNTLFAGFEDANKAADILIFYKVRDWGASIGFHGRSGAVLIPKKGLLTHACPAVMNPILLG